MTAYDILTNLRSRGEQLDRLSEKLDMLRDAVTHITPAYGEHAGGSSQEDKMAAHASRVDEILEQQARVRRLQADETVYCVQLAETLEGVKGKLAYSYYARCWTLRAFAAAEGYTEGYVRKVKMELDRELRDIQGPYMEE